MKMTAKEFLLFVVVMAAWVHIFEEFFR